MWCVCVCVDTVYKSRTWLMKLLPYHTTTASHRITSQWTSCFAFIRFSSSSSSFRFFAITRWREEERSERRRWELKIVNWTILKLKTTPSKCLNRVWSHRHNTTHTQHTHGVWAANYCILICTASTMVRGGTASLQRPMRWWFAKVAKCGSIAAALVNFIDTCHLCNDVKRYFVVDRKWDGPAEWEKK